MVAFSGGDGFRKDFLHENGISTRHRRIDWREVADSLGTEEYSKVWHLHFIHVIHKIHTFYS